MKNIFRILIILLVITLILPGCNKKEEEQKESSKKEEEQKEEIPKQLEELEKDIEKIFKEAKGPAVVEKEEDESKSSEEGKSEESKQDGQQQDGGDQEKKEESSNKQEKDSQQGEETTKLSLKKGEQEITQEITTQESKKEENSNYVSLETSDSKLAPIVKDMHNKWNTYMPMAVEKGADNKVIENFSNILNQLTVKSETINNETLVIASNLYGCIPNLVALYKTKTPPAVKSIRHYTRNSIISSMVENWPQAESDIKSLVTTWSVLKNTLSDKQKEISNKIDYSISELEKVIAEKNKMLVDTKGRVLLSNIQELEKKMEESE